jgi:valyl-tRNA synthetase
VIHGVDIYIDAHIDGEKIEEEKERLQIQIEDKKQYLRTLTIKLQNNAFLAHAPENVVRTEMEKKHHTEHELSKLEEKYQALAGGE